MEKVNLDFAGTLRESDVGKGRSRITGHLSRITLIRSGNFKVLV